MSAPPDRLGKTIRTPTVCRRECRRSCLAPAPWRIVQTPGVFFVHEAFNPRWQVFLDGREYVPHADNAPTWHGYSTGSGTATRLSSTAAASTARSGSISWESRPRRRWLSRCVSGGKTSGSAGSPFDLTGLPPTPQEVDAFLRDNSPGAYEKQVDRLLASPRYGERMAMRWLDAARYADTNGYQTDAERSMWRWRDWVIDAFNRNMPYDRFAVEQIAGDLLPGATRDQRIATGFNRNHRGNGEGGIIPEEYAVEYVVDRVDTTSTVFLGLTLGCARCHNHKFDPLTQKEFYQMFAYFNQVPERGNAFKYGNSPPAITAPSPEQEARLASIEQKAGRRRAAGGVARAADCPGAARVGEVA